MGGQGCLRTHTYTHTHIHTGLYKEYSALVKLQNRKVTSTMRSNSNVLSFCLSIGKDRSGRRSPDGRSWKVPQSGIGSREASVAELVSLQDD